MHDHPSIVTRKQNRTKKIKIVDSIPSHITHNTIFMIKKMYYPRPTHTKSTQKLTTVSETPKNALNRETRHTSTLALRITRLSYRLRVKVVSKRLNRWAILKVFRSWSNLLENCAQIFRITTKNCWSRTKTSRKTTKKN